MVEAPAMLFLADVGNTSASFGFYRRGRLTGVKHVSSDEFPTILGKLIANEKIDSNLSLVMSSVSPKITRKIRAAIKKKQRLKDRFWVIGEEITVPLRHKYISIHKLGSDRLANAYGAIRQYGAPLLILDYGTAITCDYISKKGIFMGGLIIPGPEISLKALSEKAALLPPIEFPRQYRPFIGRDTRGGMKAGILQGYGAMTDGLVERFRRRFKGRFQVIATGGFARVIYPHTHKIDILDPHLTLKSLARVYQDLIKIPS